MTTARQVYALARARYGQAYAPQLAWTYAALPDADPDVAGRVARTGLAPAMRKAARMLDQAETMTGPAPQDLLRLNVYDPRCGVGLFLSCAALDLAGRYARRLASRPRKADALAATVLPEVILACVYGMDTDLLAVELTRLVLSDYTGGRLTPGDLRRHIVYGDYTTGEMPPAKQDRTAYLGTPARVIRWSEMHA